MKANKFLIALGLCLFIIGGIYLSCFSVGEKEVVIISQFGRVVRVIDKAGIDFKLPAPLQNTLRFSTKLNVFESIPTEILTQDKKNLLINNYVVWKVKDPLLFFKTVRDEKGALIRLEDIVYSQMRNEVGLFSFTEIITSKRAEISKNLTSKVQKESDGLGIEIVDIRLKKLSFPSQNLGAIYRRMIAERKKMATKYRSEGDEEATKIRSATDKEKAIILAKSYRKAETIKGEGEAIALKKYGKIIKRDLEYYQFVRSMDIYSKIFGKDSTLILSTDSELMKFLRPPKK